MVTGAKFVESVDEDESVDVAETTDAELGVLEGDDDVGEASGLTRTELSMARRGLAGLVVGVDAGIEEEIELADEGLQMALLNVFLTVGDTADNVSSRNPDPPPLP